MPTGLNGVTLLSESDFELYDVGINGVGYRVAWRFQTSGLFFRRTPFEVTEDDILVTKVDNSDDMSENKLDLQFWRSQRSWHTGAGQRRFDQPKASDQDAFYSSKGIDVFSHLGQATLLPQTSRVIALTNSGPNRPQVMCATDTGVWVAAGQPNLKRFGALNGADATNVSTGTETSQECLSLATDGTVVYAALGPDGTHYTTGTTDTQVDACDATTGWSGTGTIAADTTTFKEGTASLKFSGDTSTNQLKTLGASFALSAADGFKVWIKWSGTPGLTDFRIRLETDASNYIERQFSALGIPSGTWTRDVSPKGAWTTTGSPGTINQIRVLRATSNNVFTVDDASKGIVDTPTNLVAPILPTVWIDDVERFQYSSMSHYSDHDSRVLAWCKDRLFGAGFKAASTTTWEFFEVGATSTSTVRLTLPDGFQITSIAELGGYVYFSAYRAGRGVIYAYDGTNAPFIAVPLPPGEQPTLLQPFLGAGLIVGARQVGSVSSLGGAGVVYRAFPDSSGHLTLERITTIGKDDGMDYSPKTGFALEDFVYFGWNYFGDVFEGSPDPANSGMGIYYPTYGGYAQSLYGATSGIVEGSCVFNGRRIFSIGSDGVYVEGASYLSSGQIVGSIFDWNIDKAKVLLTGESGYLPLPAATSVKMEYSTDGTTWTSLFTDSTVGDTQDLATIYKNATQVQYRVTLGSATGVNTPTLKKAGISSIYGTKPKRVFRFAIDAADNMTLKNGAAYPNGGAGLAWSIIAQIEALRNAQTIFSFQTPAFPFTGEIVTARIGLINWTTEYLPATGYETIAIVEVNEVPSD